MDSGFYNKVIKETCWNHSKISFPELFHKSRWNFMHLATVAITFPAQRIGYDIRLPRRILNINRVLSNGLKPYSLPQVQIGLSEQVFQALVIGEHIHLPP